jgi:hypothetical protein
MVSCVILSLSRFFFKFYFFRFPFLRLMFLFGLLNELTSGGFISPDDGWPAREFLFVNCCAVPASVNNPTRRVKEKKKTSKGVVYNNLYENGVKRKEAAH